MTRCLKKLFNTSVLHKCLYEPMYLSLQLLSCLAFPQPISPMSNFFICIISHIHLLLCIWHLKAYVYLILMTSSSDPLGTAKANQNALKARVLWCSLVPLNHVIFVMDTRCDFFPLGTGLLNIIYINIKIPPRGTPPAFKDNVKFQNSGLTQILSLSNLLFPSSHFWTPYLLFKLTSPERAGTAWETP